MKISYNWLKQYLNTDLPADTISKILTDNGLEVEGLEEHEQIKGGLKGIVVGHVLECAHVEDCVRCAECRYRAESTGCIARSHFI